MAKITRKQIEKALETAPARTKKILQTLLETGCTVEELCNIRREDVQKTSIRIQGRVSQISPQLASTLQEAKGEYVFSTRQSPQITPRRVQQLVKKELGKDITPQELRYAHIREARKAQTVQDIARRLDLTERRVHEIIGETIAPKHKEQTKAKGRDELLKQLILETGCTAKEASRLKKSDIHTSSIQIGERNVQATTSFAKQLEAYAKTHRSEYVFSTRQSSFLTERRIQQILKKQGITPTKARYRAVSQKTTDQASKETGLSKRRVATIRSIEGGRT